MFLMIMLTVSAAPVTARHANVSQNERDTPNTTVARPKTATAHNSTGPRRLIWVVIGIIAALVATAPTAGAAYNQPYPRGPTARMSCAKIGSSAVADEKKVAKKSS